MLFFCVVTGAEVVEVQLTLTCIPVLYFFLPLRIPTT